VNNTLGQNQIPITGSPSAGWRRIKNNKNVSGGKSYKDYLGDKMMVISAP